MRKSLAVWLSGALAFFPFTCLVLMLVGIGAEIAIFGTGTSIFVAMLFSLHVARNEQVDGVHKLLWAAAMLLCFPMLSVPVYWSLEILRPYRWQRKMAAWAGEPEWAESSQVE
jgi:hypothetical protein